MSKEVVTESSLVAMAIIKMPLFDPRALNAGHLRKVKSNILSWSLAHTLIY